MRPITRRGFTLAAATAAGTALTARPALAVGRAARREPRMRGMWLATVNNTDWPSRPGLTAAQQQEELLAHLDTAVRRRLNAVFFQVRPTADALWPSPYEPWSKVLTGVQGRDPGWDPLAFAVREAHRRGLQLHAWANPYRISTSVDPGSLAPGHPARRHPEWVVAYGGGLYYNPGLPEVRRFVTAAVTDPLRRHDVDGIHFDDYFYPYPVAGQTFDDAAAYARFGRGHSGLAAWRRHNTDALVVDVAARVRAAGRGRRFGVSPFGVWRNRATDPAGSATTAGVQTYDDLYADTRRWVTEGWIDYVVPQVYWNIGFPAADYAVLVPWWAETVAGTRVALYVGEALYKAGDPAQPAAWQDPGELSRHLNFDAGHPGVHGNVFFSATQVASDPAGAMARVVRDHYRHRAPAPR